MFEIFEPWYHFHHNGPVPYGGEGNYIDVSKLPYVMPKFITKLFRQQRARIRHARMCKGKHGLRRPR